MSPRKLHLDFLRLFAIYLVVWNHTPAFSMPFQTESSNFFQSLMSCLDKGLGVPLFLMISGALLLHKNETINIILKKRVLRFVQALFLFLLLQYTYAYLRGKYDFCLQSFINDFYYCSINKSAILGKQGAGVVWYFGIYLGFLFLLPALRAVAQNMKNEAFYYFGFMQLACGCLLPYIFSAPVKGLAITLYFPLCNIFCTYALAGYFCEHRINIDKIKRVHWVLLSLVSLALIICSVLHMNTQPGVPTLFNISAFLFFPCCVLYLLSKKLCKKIIPFKKTRLIELLSGAVFTVMILENLIRKGVLRWFGNAYFDSYYPSFIVALLVVTFCLGIGIILKKVPYFKTIL